MQAHTPAADGTNSQASEGKGPANAQLPLAKVAKAMGASPTQSSRSASAYSASQKSYAAAG